MNQDGLKLAKALRKRRAALGLSQEMAAERAGVGTRYYQLIESKTPPDIRISMLKRLAAALKTTPEKLLK